MSETKDASFTTASAVAAPIASPGVRTVILRANRNPQESVLRLMPMEEMRDAKVEGFMPSNSAAPPGPETFPLAV